MLTCLPRFLPNFLCRDRAGARRPRPHFRPALEQLDERTLLSATATIAALGDSITASYQKTAPQGAAGDRSWVQQLQAECSKHLTIDNEAVVGTTSANLGGQVATVAGLIRAGSVQYATLIVGANDVTANLPTIFAGNPTPFVTEVVANIESALDTLAAAGDVHLVLGNIPDISITPSFVSQVPNPLLRQEVAQATTMANQQIEAFAASRAIPVIDLFGLGHLAQQPLTIDGVQLNNLYAPDGFHPGSVAQGLLADTILEALGGAYAPSLERFELTEQQLLDNAPTPIPHQPGHTFFDVSPFVLVSGKHDGERNPAIGRLAAFGGFAGVGAPDAGWGAMCSPAAENEGVEALDRLFAAADAGSPGETVFGSRPR